MKDNQFLTDSLNFLLEDHEDTEHGMQIVRQSYTSTISPSTILSHSSLSIFMNAR